MSEKKKELSLTKSDKQNKTEKSAVNTGKNMKTAAKTKTKPKQKHPEQKKKTIIKYFRDATAEFKKVVWPTKKQVINNTAVVLAAILVSSLAVLGLDSLFMGALKLVLKMA
jgi:preprotein translocase subunit SecE